MKPFSVLSSTASPGGVTKVKLYDFRLKQVTTCTSPQRFEVKFMPFKGSPTSHRKDSHHFLQSRMELQDQRLPFVELWKKRQIRLGVSWCSMIFYWEKTRCLGHTKPKPKPSIKSERVMMFKLTLWISTGGFMWMTWDHQNLGQVSWHILRVG